MQEPGLDKKSEKGVRMRITAWALSQRLTLQQLANASNATSIILLTLEFMKSGVVSNYLDMHVIYGVALAINVLAVWTQRIDQRHQGIVEKKVSAKDFAISAVIGILSTVFLWIKLTEIGSVGAVSAVLGGTLIGLVIFLVLHLRDQD